MALSISGEWDVPDRASLAWHQWDGEYVFHHALSNNTYRLAELPGALVQHLLQTGPAPTDVLSEHFQTEPSDMEAILTELARLNFVACLR
jgi:hypothetical protein